MKSTSVPSSPNDSSDEEEDGFLKEKIVRCMNLSCGMITYNFEDHKKWVDLEYGICRACKIPGLKFFCVNGGHWASLIDRTTCHNDIHPNLETKSKKRIRIFLISPDEPEMPAVYDIVHYATIYGLKHKICKHLFEGVTPENIELGHPWSLKPIDDYKSVKREFTKNYQVCFIMSTEKIFDNRCWCIGYPFKYIFIKKAPKLTFKNLGWNPPTQHQEKNSISV